MTEVVASARNSRVQAARKLARRRERRAAGAFLVEGPHAVAEALEAGYDVRDLFVTPAAADRHADLLRRAAAAGVVATFVTERVVSVIGDTVQPQGLVAVVAMPAPTLADVLPGRSDAARSPAFLVVLDAAADPGNAGSVIRTADAVGADAVAFTSTSVDPFGPKCVRATTGSLFHLPVLAGVDVEAIVTAAKDAGVQVLATALDGDPLDDVERALAAPTMWLFGSEAHGLAPAAAAAADRRVRIPMSGRAESLNLAVAAGICLHATARARRSTPAAAPPS